MSDEEKFKTAVIDALVVSWLYEKEHSTNPQKALADLLNQARSEALDPLISAEAKALWQSGYDAAREQDVELTKNFNARSYNEKLMTERQQLCAAMRALSPEKQP